MDVQTGELLFLELGHRRYVYASGILDRTFVPGIEPSVLDGCPGLRSLVERVAGHPRVKEWNDRHS